MAIPVGLIVPAIELALQVIERAIAAGEITPEVVAKRVDAARKSANAADANLDAAIERAENKA